MELLLTPPSGSLFRRPQEKAGRRIDDGLVCEPMPFHEAIPFVSVFTLQDHGKLHSLSTLLQETL